MSRTLSIIALAVLLTGCTRYGTRANGPFAVKPKPNPSGTIPPGPAANSSQLALANELQPLPPLPPEEGQLIPPRGTEGSARGVIPAGGTPPEEVAGFPPLRKRRPDPTPPDLPSPFAPKDGGMSTPKAPDAKAPEPKAPPAAANAKNLAEVKKLAEGAAAKWEKVEAYEATVTRRELAPNKVMSDDTVLFQFRKEPLGVYMRNIGESGKGREILYSPGKHGDAIHAIVGEGDGNLLYKTGAKAPAVSPDFPLVKSKTRYSIREAGYGTPITRLNGWVTKAESGKIPAENLTSVGPVNRKEYPYPLQGVQLVVRPGDDQYLPNGGMRQWFFDTKADSTGNGYPVLIIATEPNGKEVEYYLFEKLNFEAKFTDADFSPDRLGKKKP